MSEKVKIVVSADCHDFATTQGMNAFKYVNSKFIERGYELVLLECDKAVRENVVPALEGASFFYGVGHGNEDVFTGWKLDRIFWTCDSKALSGKLSYLLSCSTGKRLGYDIIEKKGISYIGYSVDFTWMVKDRNQLDPLKDEYAKWFFTPIVELLTVLASGGRMIDAHQRAYDEFTKGIEYWRKSNDPNAFWIVYWLTHDRDGQVLYGDPEARIPTRPTKVFTSSIELSFSTESTIGRIEAPTRVVRRPSLIAPLVVAMPVLSEELKKEEKIALSLASLAMLLKYFAAVPPVPPRPVPPTEAKVESRVIQSLVDRGEVTPSVKLESTASIAVEDTGKTAIPVLVGGEDTISIAVESAVRGLTSVEGDDLVSVSASSRITVLLDRRSSISVSLSDSSFITVTRVIRSSITSSLSDEGSIGKTVSVVGYDSVSVTALSDLKKEVGVIRGYVNVVIHDSARATATRRFMSTASIMLSDTTYVTVTRRATSNIVVSLVDGATVGKTVRVNGYDSISMVVSSNLRKNVEVIRSNINVIVSDSAISSVTRRLMSTTSITFSDTAYTSVTRRTTSNIVISLTDSATMGKTTNVVAYETIQLNVVSSASRT